ncbi:MAG: tetratricopeptide repeat protein [Pseudomonadota bacterium]
MSKRIIFGARALVVGLCLAAVGVTTTAKHAHADWEDDYFACLSENNANRGIEACERTLRSPALTGEERAGVFQALAKFQRKTRQYDAARSSLEQSLALDPSNLVAMVAMGDAHYADQNFVLARDSYSEVLSRNSADVRALNNRALAFAALGEFDAALQDLQLALTLTPNNGDIWNNRANLNCRFGRASEAFTDRMQALYSGRFTAAAAQAGLRSSGYYRGPADGIWGPDSEDALKDWTDAGCPDAPKTRLI